MKRSSPAMWLLTRCLFVVLASAFSSPAIAGDVRTISSGEEVAITDHLAPGKLTLIDFYADWCGPCKTLAPRLHQLADTYDDRLAIRKINVTQWSSPVAAQYRIQSIPHLKLFDEEGHLVTAGNAPMVLGELQARLGAGGRPMGEPAHTGGSSAVVPIMLLGLVVAALFFFLWRRPPPKSPLPATVVAPPMQSEVTAATWFVMLQGSLEGPFSQADLEDMLRRKVVTSTTKVRRRGDADWRELRDIVEL